MNKAARIIATLVGVAAVLGASGNGLASLAGWSEAVSASSVSPPWSQRPPTNGRIAFASNWARISTRVSCFQSLRVAGGAQI